MESMSDEEMVAFSASLRSSNDLSKILPEAFALVREAAWRVLSLRPYDCQILAGLALNAGSLAELATGEGKTLACVLPSFLNALTGKGVMVVTTNDYLAARDRAKMGQVLEFLGLTVGVVTSDMSPQQRKVQYACDVTYTTNAELGFDYLRDNLAMTTDEVVVGQNVKDRFCIVDEVDSILIDEARTPLIISKQVDADAAKYEAAKKIADALFRKVHYDVDEKGKAVTLTEKGFEDSENALGVKSLFEVVGGEASWAGYITNAVKAKEVSFFERPFEHPVGATSTL